MPDQNFGPVPAARRWLMCERTIQIITIIDYVGLIQVVGKDSKIVEAGYSVENCLAVILLDCINLPWFKLGAADPEAVGLFNFLEIVDSDPDIWDLFIKILLLDPGNGCIVRIVKP